MSDTLNNIDPDEGALEHLLHQAMEEIRSLRHSNEILAAKVGVMELFATVLMATPRSLPEQGWGEDVMHSLHKRVQIMQTERAARFHREQRMRAATNMDDGVIEVEEAWNPKQKPRQTQDRP